MKRNKPNSSELSEFIPILKVTTPSLNAAEYAQLGSTRLLRNGKPSLHPWPTASLWTDIREHLVARSFASNPKLDVSLTAYTPGETLALLANPTISSWHRKQAKKLPKRYSRVVFVPCAKTKPWEGPAVAKSRLYSAYNQLRPEMPSTCFVTISEPLGVVLDQYWSDFPQYDNPGLFTDDSQRSSMMKSDWESSGFDQCYGVPFDPEARTTCLDILGKVVGSFMMANRHVDFVSFVDSISGPPSTHGLMLDVAIEATNIEVTRYPKRPGPRMSPLDWMRSILY